MKVNEIFYSLQGEGRFTGTPAVFIRLSGCNMACDFCDTQHHNFTSMTEEEIIVAVAQYSARHVVITGGEPTLQLTASLVTKLHAAGKFVQIETNGTIKLADGLDQLVDWVTVSPKYGRIPDIQRIDELKVVYDMAHLEHVDNLDRVEARHHDAYYLQPCDRGDKEYNASNLASCISYILAHPKWRLSLQTHKLLNIQ
ncbi:MAG: 7-carboxy-7-deazaguanine synthase QueE [Muribaculaceae bacterium]|nr:7-carboxy-7-deazaguanine synthase QueE [Muribaculaceae bacterium]